MSRRCSSGKIPYKNQGDARNSMWEANRKDPMTMKLRNVYSCPECNKWHMTSQPRHGYDLRVWKGLNQISMDTIAAAAFEIRSEQLVDSSTLRKPVVARVGISHVVKSLSVKANKTVRVTSSDNELKAA